MTPPLVPLPMPDAVRAAFVNRKTKRLSPHFFFDRKGNARRYVVAALDQISEENRSIFMAWTPFAVAVQHLEVDGYWFERCQEWLAEYAEDCWYLWMANFGGSKPVSAIGFRSQRDATLFKLFCA